MRGPTYIFFTELALENYQIAMHHLCKDPFATRCSSPIGLKQIGSGLHRRLHTVVGVGLMRISRHPGNRQSAQRCEDVFACGSSVRCIEFHVSHAQLFPPFLPSHRVLERFAGGWTQHRPIKQNQKCNGNGLRSETFTHVNPSPTESV